MLLAISFAGCNREVEIRSSIEDGPGGSPSSPGPGPRTPGAPESDPPGTEDPSSGDTASAASWFGPNMFFNQSVRNSPVDAQSQTIINALVSRGGWGYGRIQIDFSIDVYFTDSSTIRVPFLNGGMYLPDSDVPSAVPMAPSGTAGFESSGGRICDGGDCHYLVVDREKRELLESYVSSASSSQFQSNGSLAIWPFDKSYPTNLRGDVCTSADAAGFPIAPMLFSADEVASGAIRHAIRFILPNNRIQCRTYVRPATHCTGPSNCVGWATTNGVPYGARFRLRASYPVDTLPSAGAKVIARALQEYGMILSDGGNIALTAQSDRNSTAKWSTLLNGSRDLEAVQPGDFEMVEGGTRLKPNSIDCVRN
ncbi:MAG: hypothetical protein A2428_11625 [Bdellovibrionales bacterium RIFOXYC1_FULL_54_43]|nr:MAG: hypothetical protein A2428_11625 [Bdellovibrionales bacterium RIFOXYC1_FULL_54_43]